jgi:hypothetical protein
VSRCQEAPHHGVCRADTDPALPRHPVAVSALRSVPLLAWPQACQPVLFMSPQQQLHVIELVHTDASLLCKRWACNGQRSHSGCCCAGWAAPSPRRSDVHCPCWCAVHRFGSGGDVAPEDAEVAAVMLNVSSCLLALQTQSQLPPACTDMCACGSVQA